MDYVIDDSFDDDYKDEVLAFAARSLRPRWPDFPIDAGPRDGPPPPPLVYQVAREGGPSGAVTECFMH